MSTLNEYGKSLIDYAHNPDAMASILLSRISAASVDGVSYQLTNPTDPVAVLAEMATMMGHATIEANRQHMPIFYPAMARDFDDLYRHMSDGDMLDVFAQPSTAVMQYIISYDSLINKAEPKDGKGIRKLTIPRDSQVVVAGYTFTQQYPIELRVLPYGSVQAYIDSKNKNPTNPLPDVFLNCQVTTLPNTDIKILVVDVPMMQYAIATHHNSLVADLGWEGIYTYKNHFYTARVWNFKNGGWVELPTKYSKVGYDRTKPTAVIKVDRNTVKVSIPEIYIKSGMVTGDIRVDIYDTLGPINVNLGGYSIDDYTINMRDFNKETENIYQLPLKNFELFGAMCSGYATGGRAQLPFDVLKERIINNAIGVKSLPISEKQLINEYQKSGISLEKVIDYVTNRVYHASSDAPASTIPEVSSPIGTLNGMAVLDRLTLEQASSVIQHGQRFTITPDTVYKNDGSFKIDVNMTNSHKLLPKRDLVALANQGGYYFSPFHYVLDLNNESVDVRPYWISTPKVVNRRFIDHNETLGLDVYTQAYSITKFERGYKIQTRTKSEKPYQDLRDDQLFAQLSFNLTADDRSTAYVNGTIVDRQDDERVWEFIIETTLDIDRNDELIVNNFRVIADGPVAVPIPLDVTLNLFYGTVDYYPNGYRRSLMDEIVVSPTRDAKAITHETLGVLLGKSLKLLWTASRPINDTINYERYEDTVYKTWEVNIVKMNGKYPEYEIIDLPGGGKDVRVVYEHRVGELMLDENGEKIIKHRPGDVVYASNNKPVIANPRSIMYQFALSAFDAKYLFSDTRATKTYLVEVVESIVNMVTVTLVETSKQLLDETKIRYKPKTTIGHVEILRDDGSKDYIPSDMVFRLRTFLTAANRSNVELIKKVNDTIRRELANYLKENRTISLSDMAEYIKASISGVTITIEFEKMGPEADLSMFTVLDQSASINVSKRLEISPEGSIVIKDNVIITPTRHENK